MNIRLSFFISALLMLFLLSILSCEGDVSTVSEDAYGPVEDAAVSFGVKWPEAPQQEAITRTMVASVANIQNECDTRGVDKVRVEVKSGSGGSLKSATFDCAAGQGSLTGIEPQSGYTIVVTGLSDSGVAVYQGGHAGVTLHAGMNNVGTVHLNRTRVTNPVGMSFVYIEPGTFMMGSPEDEPGREDYHKTQHQVTLTQGYYMQTTEVTQRQWMAMMGSNPSFFSNCDDCPVEMVSWYDVQEFIVALNAFEGTDRYVLPTEAQWEYAARAGSTTAFANGQITDIGSGHDPVLDRIGWYWFNSEAPHHYGYFRGTQPVAQKEPNAWNLYDMHGNVCEWTSGGHYHYPSSSAVVDPTIPLSNSNKIARGGAYSNSAKHCRSAYRIGYPPDQRMDDCGFRLLRLIGQ